jgi:hypothetical protein
MFFAYMVIRPTARNVIDFLLSKTCDMAVGETRYIYYRLKRVKEIKDVSKSPEFQSTLAIESLVLQEDQKRFEEQKVQLFVSSDASVLFPNLSKTHWLAVRQTFSRKCLLRRGTHQDWLHLRPSSLMCRTGSLSHYSRYFGQMMWNYVYFGNQMVNLAICSILELSLH